MFAQRGVGPIFHPVLSGTWSGNACTGPPLIHVAHTMTASEALLLLLLGVRLFPTCGFWIHDEPPKSW